MLLFKPGEEGDLRMDLLLIDPDSSVIEYRDVLVHSLAEGPQWMRYIGIKWWITDLSLEGDSSIQNWPADWRTAPPQTLASYEKPYTGNPARDPQEVESPPIILPRFSLFCPASLQVVEVLELNRHYPPTLHMSRKRKKKGFLPRECWWNLLVFITYFLCVQVGE